LGELCLSQLQQVLPTHVEITLDPTLLDRLAGRYSVSADLVLTVTRKDGHLAMQENEEVPGELSPEGKLRFFSKTSDDVSTFELDSQGRVIRLVIQTVGRSIPVIRIN
jgi:hypothetical protein